MVCRSWLDFGRGSRGSLRFLVKIKVEVHTEVMIDKWSIGSIPVPGTRKTNDDKRSRTKS